MRREKRERRCETTYFLGSLSVFSSGDVDGRSLGEILKFMNGGMSICIGCILFLFVLYFFGMGF